MTTNCYLDEATGTARFLEDPGFILAPTLFQRFRPQGCPPPFSTCKAKTLKLLGGDAVSGWPRKSLLRIARRYGPSTHVQFRDKLLALEIALDLLTTHRPRPDLCSHD